MNTADPQFQKKFKYHHGNLREALVGAALDILQDKGVEELSLRALAKATGVTQAAPYSHFSDKDELLAAVAETGFQRLALQMAEDAAAVRVPRARVESLISSYLRFALNNKALFRLMFGREVSDMKRFPTLALTADKSRTLIAASLSGRAAQGADTEILTVAIWSMCQGLADLVVGGKLDLEQMGVDNLDDFVSKTVDVFAGALA